LKHPVFMVALKPGQTTCRSLSFSGGRIDSTRISKDKRKAIWI